MSAFNSFIFGDFERGILYKEFALAVMNPSLVQGNSMSRAELLTRILRTLHTSSPDIVASAILSEDGLMLASALPSGLDETRIGGMTATLLSLGSRAAHELERGQVQEIVVRGSEGYAAVMNASTGTLLLCLSSKSARLGVVFYEMRKTIDDLSNVL